jgi:Mn-containing catalase
VQAPWNSGTGLELVADPPMPADGGDGNASVNLTDAELAALEAMKTRLASDPAVDPTTGAELGKAKA